MVKTIYAVGDIHGDLDQLKRVFDLIEADISSSGLSGHRVVFIGDLTDRRANSKGVIDFILQGQAAGKDWIVIKGNHDRLFQWFLEDPLRADSSLRSDYTWLHPRMGGRETLLSYGVVVHETYVLADIHAQALAAVPNAHQAFLQALPLFYETDEVFFCHAGIKPGVPFADQAEDDLLWIRNPFFAETGPHPKLIIHGHTPVDDVTHYGNRVNIDTGAAWGKTLSVVAIEGRQISVLAVGGRKAVHLD